MHTKTLKRYETEGELPEGMMVLFELMAQIFSFNDIVKTLALLLRV